jgi:hypothetical protein
VFLDSDESLSDLDDNREILKAEELKEDFKVLD